jgi:hypothetical protein
MNKYPWHDQVEITYDDEIIGIIDRDIHPLYLRLLEQVYYYFVLLISFVNRKIDGKGTDGLDLFNAVEDIKLSIFPELADYYKHTIRNGIAHGKFTYYDHAIEYRDKKEEVKAEAKEIIEFTDDLLDLCNGMALSLHMFFLYNKSDKLIIPQQLLLKEIQLETGTPWWIVNSYLQSEKKANRQIIIYIETKHRDYLEFQYNACFTAVLAEQLIPGFDRYYLSINSQVAYKGWAIFNGKELKGARENSKKEYSKYKNILESIVYIPKINIRLPRIVWTLMKLYNIIKQNLPLVIKEIIQKNNPIMIMVRIAKVHINGWKIVLNSSVVIENSGNINITISDIRKQINRIINITEREGRRKGRIIEKLLPLGYAKIKIYNKDFRIRKLQNYGLENHLVCEIEFKKIKRIRSLYILGSTLEKYNNNIVIAWNRKWLESNN